MTHALAKSTKVWIFTLALTANACGNDDDGDRDRGRPQVDAGGSQDSGGAVDEDAGDPGAPLTFFVSSEGSMTGDLGGLSGADAHCERLAQAVGRGAATWRAYLSAERTSASDDAPVHARERIGTGPWHNAEGTLLADDLDALHAIESGDAELFLDEQGNQVPGQWAGSPTPIEHDILTGSTAEGMLMAGQTCADWTSDSAELTAQVGHSDGLGPMANPDPPYASWSSSHANAGCNDTVPRGGAGRIYCFAAD